MNDEEAGIGQRLGEIRTGNVMRGVAFLCFCVAVTLGLSEVALRFVCCEHHFLRTVTSS